MRKGLSMVLAAAMLLTTLAGCAGGKEASSGGQSSTSDGKKVLTLSYTGDISTLDMNLCYNSTTAEVLSNTVATLFKHDLEGKLTNEVCKDYTVSEDGTVYTFNLRDDFKWTNGDPVTAHDFVYSWRRLGSPDTGSTYANYLSNAHIVNAEGVVNGELDVSELGVTAPNDYTLEVRLDRPVPYLLTFLCEAAFLPVNQKFQESLGDKFGTSVENALFSGAYVVADWQTEYEIRLEKNPDYPMADQVAIDTVVIKIVKDANTAVNLFETGELDLFELDGEQAVMYQDDPNAHAYSTTEMSFLIMNEQNPILANANTRRAISCVLDKQFITDEIYANGSTPADYIIPFGLDFDESGNDFRTTTNIPSATDIEQGKKYWEQAKQELNLPEYEIRLMTSDNAKSKRLAEFFQSQLEKNLDGLTVTFDYTTSKTRIDKEISGDFDTAFSTWAVQYLDLAFFIDMFTTGFYANTGYFSNAEYDELAALANGEYLNDKEKRWEALRRAEEILVVEEMGTIPIFQGARMFLVSDQVEGYHYSNVTPQRFFGIMDIAA